MTRPGAGSDVAGIRTRASASRAAIASPAADLDLQRQPRRVLRRLRQDRAGRRPPRHERFHRAARQRRPDGGREPCRRSASDVRHTCGVFRPGLRARDHRLGEEGGFALAMAVFDHSRPMVASPSASASSSAASTSRSPPPSAAAWGKRLTTTRPYCYWLAHKSPRCA